MDLFPTLPDKLADLTDEQLAEALAKVRAVSKDLLAGEVPEGTTPAERVALLEQGVELKNKLVAETEQRAQDAEAADAKLAELAAEFAEDEPEGEADPAAEGDEPTKGEEADPDEGEPADSDEGEGDPEGAEEREAVLVAAAKKRRKLPAGGTGDRAPKKKDEKPEAYGVLTAAADLAGFSAGQTIETDEQLAEATMTRYRAVSAIQGGTGQKYVVASMRTHLPDERTLTVEDGEIGNMRKIERVVLTPKRTLQASGGLCAPVTPLYDLPTFATAARPVRDSLPRFNADRGGIRFMPPPKLSAFANAVGRITAAQDAAGGTSAVKSCLRVACPSTIEVDVAAIYRCITFGNMGARAFPEQVANANENVLAVYAQKAETALLDGIAAASTAVTTVSIANSAGGAISTLLSQLIEAAAGLRSRNRIAPNTTLRCLLPDWVLDSLHVDALRNAFNRFTTTDATFEQELRKANIVVSWYLDTPTAGGQVFGTQNAGALLGFPATVISFLYPEGSFLFLDSGQLDIGIVRDSVLNATNDYQIFAEGFENVAFTGLESLEITHNICASGETTATKAAPATCAI